MIEIKGCGKGAFVPANNDEENGQIMGRCNALHDWLMLQVKRERKYYTVCLSDELRTVCTLMGFTDVLAAAEVAEKEPMSFTDMLVPTGTTSETAEPEDTHEAV